MKSFPTCINLNYKIQNCFLELEGNAYIPSIQRLHPSSPSLSSQGCRSPFKRLFPESEGNAYIPSIQRHFPLLPLSHLKAAGALLKDSPCSFSLGGYATALNRLHNHPPPRWWSAEKPPTCISISSASAHYQSMQLTDWITSCPS